MNKLSKKTISLMTTCAITLSLSNPVLIVAAQEVKEKTSLEQLTVEESKCNLSSLSVTGKTLSPSFSQDVLDYTLPDLPYSTDSITVKATAENEDSTVKITYTNYEGEQKTATSAGRVSNLKYGKNIINVTVTSDDESETKTYTISVVRKAALKSLTASIDGKEIALNPEFTVAKNEYTATIHKGSESVLIKASANISTALSKITVNGEVLGEDGVNVKLNGSTNNISVAIAGEDGNGENIYNLTIKEVDKASLTVKSNLEGVNIRLIDSTGVELGRSGNYQDLLAGETYTLIVTKYGYIVNKQEIELKEGAQEVNVTLEKAPANNLKEVVAEWKNFRGNDENMGITNAKTPRNSQESYIKWNTLLGTSWSDSPSVQIVVDDSVVVMSGTKIYKLSKKDGNKVAEGTMVKTSNFGYTPPIYTDKMIIVPLSSGIVQAFDAKTLKSLWVSESFGGQSLSPIASSDGNVYLGFWNGETKDADFVCLTTTDEDPTKTDETKYASWKFTVKGGFYWAGAYITGDNLIIGTDDGENGTKGTGHVYSLNKNTGEVIDSIDVEGDQRSTISYDKTLDRIFFTTKAGYLYTVKVNENGTFDKTTLIKGKNQVQCTSTPTVYNGRVYYGTGSINNPGALIVADAKTLDTIYEVPLKGYPQASVLLSTAYEKSENGKVYVYCTYNASPGGITVIEDAPGQTEAKYSELFEVPSELSQYCIASPVCDSDGTIYYKNDSRNVIAIATKKSTVNVTFDANNGTESVVKSVSEDESLDYSPEAPTKEGYTFVGWYSDVNDITTKYESGKTYTQDVTFTAKYAHFEMLGAQVRNNKTGIRFGTKIYNDGDELIEKGTIILPINFLSDGEVLTLNTKKAVISVGKVNYEVNEKENYVTYLGTLVGIPEAQFDAEITASAYATYKDSKGNIYTVYSPYKYKSTTINKLSANN